MSKRNVSRPWTEEEDKLLIDGVAEHGDQDTWKKISLSIPGRTNKACRKRWLHSLIPELKKTAWTVDEDKLLLELYEQQGPRWSNIARDIPGRTDDACSKRYREALDPSLKKDEWTPEEDSKLMEACVRLGGKWGQVGHEFNRSGLGCRNRWRLLERKRKAREALLGGKAMSASEPTSPAQVVGNSAQLEVDGPIYYPPDAYNGFSSNDLLGNEHSFRESNPGDFRPVHAILDPTQLSSTSSLSTALSDPPKLHKPLPAVSAYHEGRSNSEPLPSLFSSPLYGNIAGTSHNELAPLDGLPEVSELDLGSLFASVLDYNLSGSYFHHEQPNESQDSAMYCSMSPISFLPDMPHGSALFGNVDEGTWKSPIPPDLYTSTFIDGHFNQSSATSTPFTSTPFALSTSLSPISSPNGSLPADLPYQYQFSSGSLLFSPHNGSFSPHPFAAMEISHDGQAPSGGASVHPPEPTAYPSPKRSRKTSSKRSVKQSQVKPAGRLSSALKLCSDSSLKPYACGLDICWPGNALASLACYSTSAELLEHNREHHSDHPLGDKPYRCSLTGCGKSWKTINGLQYHLQVSQTHFKQALSSMRLSGGKSNPGTPSQESEVVAAGSGTEAEADNASNPTKQVFSCTRPDCSKTYRQMSGLRYHLKHGHPEEIPVQLSTVPPALASYLSKKDQKKSKSCSNREVEQ